MNIIQDFIPVGRKNRPQKANAMKYVTIHNTGNSSKGAGAKNHAAYVKGDSAANLPVSWHYTVDEFGAYQHLPDNEVGLHAGDGGNGTGNNQSIGIEICMNSDGNLQGATDNAVLLTAELCKKHNIPIENVVQHYKWTGKICPQMIRAGKPYDWNTFISKVKAAMGNTTPATPSTPTTPATPSTGFKVGDIVQFGGGAVYVSSAAANPAHSRGKSRCKVTQTYNGKHPYHLISEDGGNVYGWVDAVNVSAIGSTLSTPALKSIDEIAKEVINGKWGNGDERKKKLTAAGYDYATVQARVNQLLK